MASSSRGRVCNLLLAASCAAVAFHGSAGTAAAAVVQTTTSRESARVSAETVSRFFSWIAGKKASDVTVVWKEATRVFPAGALIERYPDVFKDRLPTQPKKPLNLIGAQLARDGVKLEGIEALTLFRGDNGMVTVDVMLVIAKADGTIVGMYQGWSGM